jgi:O-acetyl-ADP-ribose deacetylase (regulator of RNase III)
VIPRIIESDGDIFTSGCAALVSPVDAVTGAQGKGLAKLFAQRWPDRCAVYRDICRGGGMSAGEVSLDASGDPWILFAATKRHWREPSTIAYVESCLHGLMQWTIRVTIRDIALPALGCGLGSLDWGDVRPMMLDAASRMQCERVVIYGPK